MVDVSPFIWFNDNAEPALEFYAGVFANSEIVNVTPCRLPAAASSSSEITTSFIFPAVIVTVNVETTLPFR